MAIRKNPSCTGRESISENHFSNLASSALLAQLQLLTALCSYVTAASQTDSEP